MRLIKQAWGSLAKQPLLSWISIAGTALAIFLIMVIFMSEYMKVAPFAPESNRDRWLVQNHGSIGNTEWGSDGRLNTSNGGLSYNTIRRTLYEMELPEAVAAFDQPDMANVSAKGKPSISIYRQDTDHGFWKVFDFAFLSGSPYTKEDVEAGAKVAVINETVARKLFGNTDCVGKEIILDHVPYRVSGVVRDITSLAIYASGDVWVPLTSNECVNFVWNQHMGNLNAIILAKDKSDFPALREEYNKVWKNFGDEIKAAGWVFYLRERPYDQLTSVNTPWADSKPDMGAFWRRNILVYAILLLIPAINLSSMTQSRLRRRREEIGVRRAFGATKTTLMGEIFMESLIITIAAGMLGFAVSLAFALLGGASTIFGGWHVTGLTLGMLFSWKVFAVALAFCFLLNLIASLAPAWQASRTNIVNALRGHNK